MGTATSSMAAKFAFFPPNPPSYTISVDEETGKLRLSSDLINQRDNVDILKLCTKKGNEIVAMHVKNPSASLTVLYSHGNAADIGQMYHIFTELSSHLNVNLMGWVILINMIESFEFPDNNIYLYTYGFDLCHFWSYAGMIILAMDNLLERYVWYSVCIYLTL